MDIEAKEKYSAMKNPVFSGKVYKMMISLKEKKI